VQAVAFSPDGSRLALGTDTGTVAFVRRESWQVSEVARERGAINALAFNPDSDRVAAGGAAPDVELWSERGGPLATFGPHKAPVVSMAFAPDAPDASTPVAEASRPRLLVTVSRDRSVFLWSQLESKAPRQVIPDGRVAAFSPDGKLLAVGGDGGVRLLRVANDRATPERGGPLAVKGVAALAFGADGKWLVTADEAGAVQLWNLARPEPRQTIPFPAPVEAAALSPNGRYVVGASRAGVHAALLQPEGQPQALSAAEVRQLACSQARDPQLGEQDWKKYFGQEPLRFTCGPSAAAGAGAAAKAY
jgi:WD40 repeat protein